MLDLAFEFLREFAKMAAVMALSTFLAVGFTNMLQFSDEVIEGL